MSVDTEDSSSLLRIARSVLTRDHPARRVLDTDDLIQETLVTGIENVGRINGTSEGEFFGWLRKIVRSRLHRALRRKARATDRTLEDLDAFEAGATEPLVTLIREEIWPQVSKEITLLPADSSRVIELRLRGWSTGEIAKLLRLTPGTVRRRESRAMKRLCERLT